MYQYDFMAKAINIWIALFRGINVGGHNRLPMQGLKDILYDLGLKSVQSYIQSGNVVFSGQNLVPELLGQQISSAINDHYGFKPFVLVLSKTAFDQSIRDNPFTDKISENKHMHVFFPTEAPQCPDLPRLSDLADKSEEFHLGKTCFYLYAPAGIGRSKLAAKVDTCLGTKTTARNWRTVMAVMDMAKKIS